jgi:glycosyltransferase involved in cell wall biosynthesis
MLGRPHRVAPLLESIREATPDARVLFLTTETDAEVRETIDRLGCERLDVPWQRKGDYARKINTGYRHTTEPLLFTAADDLLFHPGWFKAATAKLTPGIGVVGTNDLCNRRTWRSDHSTHSLVTREYADHFGLIDRPGAIYFEGYVHEWVDDELVGTAKHRGAYAHATNAVVEHLHPMAGRAPLDDLYAQQAKRMRASRWLYQRRQLLWT